MLQPLDSPSVSVRQGPAQSWQVGDTQVELLTRSAQRHNQRVDWRTSSHPNKQGQKGPARQVFPAPRTHLRPLPSGKALRVPRASRQALQGEEGLPTAGRASSEPGSWACWCCFQVLLKLVETKRPHQGCDVSFYARLTSRRSDTGQPQGSSVSSAGPCKPLVQLHPWTGASTLRLLSRPPCSEAP